MERAERQRCWTKAGPRNRGDSARGAAGREPWRRAAARRDPPRRPRGPGWAGARGAGRALRPAAGSCTRDAATALPSAPGPSTEAWERPAQAEGEGRAGGRRTRWRRLMAASPPARRRRPAPERASAPGSPRLTWPGARGSRTRVQRLPGADGGGAGADGGGWRRAQLLPSPSLTPRLGSD